MIDWAFYREALANSAAAWTLTYLVFSTVLFGALTVLARWRPLSPATENRGWRIALVAAPLLTTGRIAVEHVGLQGLVGPDALVVAGRAGQVILLGVGVSGVVVVLLTARLWRLFRGERRALGKRGPLADSDVTAMLAELASRAGRRAPRLTRSDALRAPVAIGRNEVCLPRDFIGTYGLDVRRAMLAHELGHLVRHDPSWRTGAVLLQRLLFFQPLQRLASRRLRETSEFLADDFAIRMAVRPDALVEGLIALAATPETRETAVAFSSGSLLLQRVRRALGVTACPGSTPQFVVLGVGIVLFAAAWLSPAVVPAYDCHVPFDWLIFGM